MTIVSLLTHRYLAPVIAALVYGVWAGWVNSDHGVNVGLRVGLVQAAYAFVSTLTVAEAAKWLFKRSNESWLALTLVFIATFFVMLAIPVAVHWLAMTPDIIEAIAPGLLWGSLYILVLLYSLKTQSRVQC